MQDATPSTRPVRVVIVDDTRSIRAMIRALLGMSDRIEVVGEAGDPFEARELIRELNPDVITLDVVMPRMNGLAFLERLMRLRPMPVVMVSTRTTEKSRDAITALSLGAVDCVDLGLLNASRSRVDLVETVLMAARSNTAAYGTHRTRAAPVEQGARLDWNGRVVLIGSSTGGVDALLTVLSDFPADCPPTLIAQHMPPAFLESFARRLDRHSRASVRLARDGDRLEQGRVLLAPGGSHHAVLARRDPMRVDLVEDDGQTYVPSVDLLFSSGLPHAGAILGVMLTGMGRDGADALLALRQGGAHSIVQDAASSVIDGMPRSAREIGAASEVAALSQIGGLILKAASRVRRAPE